MKEMKELDKAVKLLDKIHRNPKDLLFNEYSILVDSLYLLVKLQYTITKRVNKNNKLIMPDTYNE